jgi:L-xylulokinase
VSRYLLGIDNGGTVSKAALFTTSGEEVGVASRLVDVLEPKPGWSERDMTALWRSTAEAIRELLTKTKVNPAEIACVATAGHGNGLYLIDKAGNPTRNGIYSTDKRAQSYVDKWLADGIDAKVLPKTTQCLWAAQPNALLAWVRDNEPEVFKKSSAVLMCKDYVRFRLTGAVQAEVTDMSGTSLLNVVTGQYDDQVLALFGIPEVKRLLPPLVKSAEICGSVTAQAAADTGLKAGTPVAGGLFDIDACALAAGIVDERQISLVAGTWGCHTYVSREPLIDKDLFMTTCFCIPGNYLMLEGSPTSASNLEWFVNEIIGREVGRASLPAGTEAGATPAGTEAGATPAEKSIYDLCNELVASVRGEDVSAIFLPFLYGSNAGLNAKGCFIGLEGWHMRAHVLRAVYEGVVFGHNTHLQRLLKFRRAPEAIRFTGGAARSQVWVQMFADCFQIPIEIPAGTELGALGAAIAAAVAAGVYPGYSQAVAAMTRIARRHEPDASKKELYERKYERYHGAIKALKNFW